MSKCNMLAIDSSTKSSGISLFTNGKYKASHLIDLSDYKVMSERFPLMIKEIYHYLEKYQPQIIYIEEAVVLKNANTQRFLVRIQGAIYAWCIFHDCECNYIRPSEWRRLLDLSSGRPKKEEAKRRSIQYIKDTMGLEVQEDVAESICIGLAVLKKWENIKEAT